MTIKHPPDVVEGLQRDSSMVGKMFDLPPQLAMLMIAAGWVRSDTRSQTRRHHDEVSPFNRRQSADRRSTTA